VCLIVPTDTAVDEMTSDARSFLAALEGLSDHDAADAVLPLPSQEVDPYRSLAPHLQIASARARALFALASGRARLIVASARALLPRASDPARLAAAGFTIAPGDEIAPTDLGERLAFAGFSPEDPVDQPGEFCVRGGVVDFYPASEEYPLRLEFIGDIVESLRRYDGATQRSLTAVDRVVVSPQREQLPDAGDDPAALDRSATVIDYVRRRRDCPRLRDRRRRRARRVTRATVARVGGRDGGTRAHGAGLRIDRDAVGDARRLAGQRASHQPARD
jgi:transcription-repair coupling factor (superfamily II helicase)